MGCFNFVNSPDCIRQDALTIGRAFTKRFTIEAEDLSTWSCRWVVYEHINGTVKADWRDGVAIAISFVSPDTLVTLMLSSADTAALSNGAWAYYVEMYKAGENPITIGEGRMDFIDRPGAE